MTRMTKTHSKLGIAACFVAFAVWFYFAIMVYLFFFIDGFTQKVTDILVPPSNGIADLRGLGVAIMVFAVVFLAVPAAGHFFGVVLSFCGLISRKTKNLFPILGLFLNLLPMAILLLLYVIGSFTPPAA
ncbi:MAG: hypothetical protein QM785_05330 [Pyrinomonadaceae bacterium]